MNSPVLVALTRAGPSRENLRAVDEDGGLPAGVSAVPNQTQGEGGRGGGGRRLHSETPTSCWRDQMASVSNAAYQTLHTPLTTTYS